MAKPSTVVVHCHPLDSSYNHALFKSVSDELGDEASCFSLYDGPEPSLDDLANASTLILVYPTWWSGLPGRLLAWYQSTFAPYLDGIEPPSSSPVYGLDRVVAITTHGSPRLLNRLQGEPGKLMLTRFVDRCTERAVLDWVALYEIDTTSADDCNDFLVRAAKAARRMEN